MKLFVKLDRERLLKRHRSSKQAIFVIYFQFGDGSYYPAEDWEDFGCVVMMWWVGELLKLYDGANRAELSFMDGPYALILHRTNQVLSVADEDAVELQLGQVTLDILKAQWCSAAVIVRDFLKWEEVFPDDARGLDQGIKMLNDKSQSKSRRPD